MSPSKRTPTKSTRKFLSFRFLFLLFLAGIEYLPSRTYNLSGSGLSSRSPFGIGVLADVVLMSTFVEVTETVPPPPAATATAAPAPAPAPDVATDTAVATATAANTGAAVSVTASGVVGSQPTGSGGGQAMVQGSGTAVVTSTATTEAPQTGTAGASSPTDSGTEVPVSGLAGTKTAFLSIPAAPSGITTSIIRGKSSPMATSTPSPTSTSTSTSSTQKFPTYAAGLASGTAIIAAAGAFTAVYLLKRRHRRHGHGQRRKPSPVNEIGDVNNNRPFSMRKVSEVMSMTNLNKPCAGGGGNKLTSMKPPPDIDPETSWPRGYIPPDPEQLRKRMDDERRRSGGSRDMAASDSAIDLGIGYVSSAGKTPAEKRDGYFDDYNHENTRPVSTISMPDHMKHIMTPLKPRHTQGFVPEPVDRVGAVSPSGSSIYSRDFSRRESIVTSFGDIHARIDGNNLNPFNPQKEEYRLRKEQVRQFGTYDFVEEEEEEEGRDDWLENGGIGQHDDYFTTQHSVVNQDREGLPGDYFSTHHSAVHPDNRESQYEDIDLSQNDPHAESQKVGYAGETASERSSGGVFGRFFSRG